MPAGHAEVNTRCIDEFEALEVERSDFLLIGRSCLLDALEVLFAGAL